MERRLQPMFATVDTGGGLTENNQISNFEETVKDWTQTTLSTLLTSNLPTTLKKSLQIKIPRIATSLIETKTKGNLADFQIKLDESEAPFLIQALQADSNATLEEWEEHILLSPLNGYMKYAPSKLSSELSLVRLHLTRKTPQDDFIAYYLTGKNIRDTLAFENLPNYDDSEE